MNEMSRTRVALIGAELEENIGSSQPISRALPSVFRQRSLKKSSRYWSNPGVKGKHLDIGSNLGRSGYTARLDQPRETR